MVSATYHTGVYEWFKWDSDYNLFSIEYMKILQACALGFLVIGFIGYIIKLVFIPINNIILAAWTMQEVADTHIDVNSFISFT